MRDRKEFRQSGFTLIELLVVIAIIAVLAAMLLGALAGAKRQVLSAVCKNHLHEMGIALRMYVDDTKFYPYYLAVGKTDGDGYFRWPQYLQPYYQLNWTNPAYHCPAYNGAVESLSSYGSVQILGSYSYNYLGAEGGLGDTGFFGESYLGIGTTGVFNEGGFPISPARPDTQVVTPADTYAIMDTAATIRYGSLYLSYFPDLYWTGSGSSGVDWAGCIDVDFQFFAPFLFQQNPKTHGQSFNVLYCDGHVTPVRLTDLFNPTNTARSWNFDHQTHSNFWSTEAWGGSPPDS